MRRVAFAAFVALAALSLGCASQIGMGRARTLDKGKHRIGFSAEADFLTPEAWKESGATLPWAQVGLGYHRGLSDRVEVGARLWGFTIPTAFTTLGGAADLKVAVLRPEEGRGDLNIAAALSLSYHNASYGGQPYHVFGGTLPVLFGVKLGRHELVLGPRVANYTISAYGMNTVNAFYMGGSLGFAARYRETFDFFPEAVAMWSPISLNGEEEVESRVGVGMFQLGFGFNWDL
ncbi:MAG TPA: hypothetical protein VLS89_10935 [Candidatus Nanopelagicales bacterium]|nr:hypothetical protein [Candidatus Nanopelagicales bacterium]